jgi:hypothetical protein
MSFCRRDGIFEVSSCFCFVLFCWLVVVANAYMHTFFFFHLFTVVV